MGHFGPAFLAFADVKALQASLVRAGYDVGAIDGFLGLKTNAGQIQPACGFLPHHGAVGAPTGRPLTHPASKSR